MASRRWSWLAAACGLIAVAAWMAFLVVRDPGPVGAEHVTAAAPPIGGTTVLRPGGSNEPRLDWHFLGLRRSGCSAHYDPLGRHFGERLSWVDVDCDDGSTTSFARTVFVSPKLDQANPDRVEVARLFADLVQLRPFLEQKFGPLVQSLVNDGFKEDCRTGATQQQLSKLHESEAKDYPNPANLMSGTCYAIEQVESPIMLYDAWLWVERVTFSGFRLHIGSRRKLPSEATFSDGVGVSFAFRAHGSIKEVDCYNCSNGSVHDRNYGRTGSFSATGDVHVELALRPNPERDGFRTVVQKTEVTDVNVVLSAGFQGILANIFDAIFNVISGRLDDEITARIRRDVPPELNQQFADALRAIEGALVGPEFRHWLVDYAVPERMEKLARRARFRFHRSGQAGDGEQLYASLTVARQWLGNDTPKMANPHGAGSVRVALSYAFVNRLLAELLDDRPLESVTAEVNGLLGTVRVAKENATRLAGIATRLQSDEWCPLTNLREVAALVGIRCGSSSDFSIPVRLRPQSDTVVSVFASDIRGLIVPTGSREAELSTSFEARFRMGKGRRTRSALKVAFESVGPERDYRDRVVAERYRAVAALLNELVNRGTARWSGVLKETPDLRTLIDEHGVWSSLQGLEGGFTMTIPEGARVGLFRDASVTVRDIRNAPASFALVVDADARL